MKPLYPAIEPFNTFFLKTESQHEIYVEQSGHPQGMPVIFLHGGPCSGTRPSHRCFFDPERYHIILFDQRGSGLSKPFGELEKNTTQDLIEDMERIRVHLNIEQWLLYSGSWGSTLALLYAQQFTQTVLGMIIRGVFLARQRDLDWFIREGANRIYPVPYQNLLACLPDQNIDYLYSTLWGEDEIATRRLARAWIQWSSQVAIGKSYQPANEPEHTTQKMVDQVKMELHFARNHYFIEEDYVLQNSACLQAIPSIIIHGRDDLVCPMEAGYRLSQVLLNASFRILEKAGHIAAGEVMIDALVGACDEMAERLMNE